MSHREIMRSINPHRKRPVHCRSCGQATYLKNNGELYLRAANSACKENKYPEAIELFKQSMELDSSLIANHVNLVQIYGYRAGYYELKEYRKKTEEMFVRLLSLFNSRTYNAVTISNADNIPSIVHQLGEWLGFETQEIKIGCNFEYFISFSNEIL